LLLLGVLELVFGRMEGWIKWSCSCDGRGGSFID
jgi:hypothetical protein